MSSIPMPSCVSSTVICRLGADGEPAPQVLGCVEGECMQDEQRQGKVVHPVPLLCQADVGLIGLMDLTQHPAPNGQR